MDRKNKNIDLKNQRVFSRLNLVKIARESRKNRLDILNSR